MLDEFQSKCRICLLETSKNISIFECRNATKYSDLIKQYIGLEIVHRDSLPSGICNVCLSELMIVIKFISKVRESIEKLDNELKTLTNLKYEDDDNLPLSFISKVTCTKEAEVKRKSVQHLFKKENVSFSDGEISAEDFYESIDQTGNENINKNHFTKDTFDSEFSDHMKRKMRNSNLKLKFKVLKSRAHGLKKDMLKCLTCGVVVQNRSASLVHIRKHTGEKPHQCLLCGKCFTQSGTLNNHMRKSHPNGVWSEKSENNTKINKRLQTMDYVCDTCGLRCKTKSTLIVHLRIHTNEKPYMCSYCPQRFTQTSTLQTHIRVHHTGEKPFFCHVCGKLFPSQTNLTVHLVSHSDERRFKCELCNKAVKTNDSLKRHTLSMHSTKHKICEVCGAAFALTYRLNQHMKIRHSRLSGQCEYCKKHFTNLDKHLKRHTGEQPFGCDFCHKRFFQRKHLVRHVKKHKNETTNFQCKYESCHSAFSKKSMLSYHISKFHTKIPPFVCQFCSRGYYRNSDMRRHLLANHNLKVDNSNGLCEIGNQ